MRGAECFSARADDLQFWLRTTLPRFLPYNCQDMRKAPDGSGSIGRTGRTSPTSPAGKAAKDLTVTVVYDNNGYREGLATGWGFSAVVGGTEKIILFDTGRDGSAVDNMEKSGIEPGRIDTVFLSHIHRDHTGGLECFLEKNSDVTIYLPKSFPAKSKDSIRGHGVGIVEVKESLKICENVYSTGQIGGWIKEQSLVVRTDKGVVLVTGCAHPGIVEILNTARALAGDDVLLVMGGFHLEWTSRGKVERIISAFRESGVRYVGPCHCTSEKPRSLFEERFGKNYINIGAGKVITMADLQ